MPEEIVIRSFREADEEPLTALWERVFPDDPAWNAPQLMIRQKLAVQPELLLVAEHAGALIGAVIAGYDGVRGWIYHLAVAPEHRRQGHATKLVRSAEQRLRQLGCKKLNLQVRTGNDAVGRSIVTSALWLKSG